MEALTYVVFSILVTTILMNVFINIIRRIEHCSNHFNTTDDCVVEGLGVGFNWRRYYA